MSSWGAAIRSAGRRDSAPRGSGPSGIDYRPGSLSVPDQGDDWFVVADRMRRRMQEEQDRQAAEDDSVNKELARQAEDRRKDAEKKQRGALDLRADQAKKASADAEKARDADEARAAKAADLAGTVREKLSDESARQAEDKKREAARNADRRAAYDATDAVASENRATTARQRAEREAKAMQERIDLHEKQQKLETEKKRSAALATPKGRRKAEELSAAGQPVPAARSPLVVSEQDRELHDVVRGKDPAALEAWVQKKASEYASTGERARAAFRPTAPTPLEPKEMTGAAGGLQIEQTPEGVRMGSGVRDWLEGKAPRTAEENEARYRALMAGEVQPENVSDGQHAVLDRNTLQALPSDAPAPRPATPRAVSGRTATVAPSVRSGGLGGSVAAPAAVSAPRPAQRPPMAPPAAPAPAPQPPALPGTAPAPPPGGATAAASQPPPGGPTPLRPANPQQKTPVFTGLGLESDPQVLAVLAKVHSDGQPIGPTLQHFERQKYGPEVAGFYQEIRRIRDTYGPEKAQQWAQQMMELNKVTAAGLDANQKAEMMTGIADALTSPRALAAMGVRMVGSMGGGVVGSAVLPVLGTAGGAALGGALAELPAAAIEQGTLTPKLTLDNALNPLVGALPIGAAERIAPKELGSLVTKAGAKNWAKAAGVGALEGMGISGGQEAALALAHEQRIPSFRELAPGLAAGAVIGAGARTVMGRGQEHFADRAVAKEARSEAGRLENLQRAMREGQDWALRMGKDIEAGASFDQAYLAEAARQGEASMPPEAPAVAPEAAAVAPAERAKVNERPAGEAVRTVGDVQGMFPRAKVEDLGGGKVRVHDSRFAKPVDVELSKAEVSLKPGTVAETRGAAELQPGEYVAGRTDTSGPEAKLEVRSGEGRDTAMHEVTHAVEALTEQGSLSAGDRAALDANARFRALAEARRRGLDWKTIPEQTRQNLMAEARADLVGEYSQIKGPGKVASNPAARAAAKVGDFLREARQGGTAGNAAERVRVGDYGESLPSRAGRALHEGWQAADAFVNPRARDEAALGRSYSDTKFASMAGGERPAEGAVPPAAEQAAVRRNAAGEVERLPSGYEEGAKWDEARVRAQLARIGSEVGPQPEGVSVVDGSRGKTYVFTRDGKVTAAMPLRQTEGEALPSPHMVREKGAGADMAALRARLQADESAAGRQTYQYQREAVSPDAAEAWNRRAAQSPEARAYEEAHLHPGDKAELAEYDRAQRMVPREDTALARPEAERLAREVLAPDGGFSYRTADGTSPKDGHMVSVRPDVASEPIPVGEVTPEVISDFARKNAAILAEPGAHMGGWHNPEDGKVYLDISKRVDTPEEAQALGREHKQIAYFDLAQGRSVKISDEQASIRKRKDFELGKESPVRGTGRNGQITVEDVAKHLQADTLKRLGEVTGEDPKAVLRRALTLARKEVAHQLEGGRSGHDWYKGDVQKLDSTMARVFPELETQPAQKTLFKTVVALLSPNTKPNDNLMRASRLWNEWRSSGYDPGKVPVKRPADLVTEGQAGQWGRGTEFALTKLQRLLTQEGSIEKAVAWLQAEHPVRELREAGWGDLGHLGVGDNATGFEVFGPKVGQFVQNLEGNASRLTVDKWFMRTWGRYMGTLVDSKGLLRETPLESQRPIMEEMAGRVGKRFGMDPADVQATLWYYEQQLYRELGAKIKEVSFGESAEGVRREIERYRAERGGAAGAREPAPVQRPLALGEGPGDVPPGRAPEGGGEAPHDAQGVAPSEQASVRWSNLPEKGLAEEQAAKAAGDTAAENRIRQGREVRSDIADSYRRFTGRAIDRIAEIKSPEGRDVGGIVAEQMRAADEYGVEQSSRGVATFDRAYDAFARLTKKQGGDVDASWRRVVDALDARKAENGRLAVGFADLTPSEKGLYTVTKAVLNQAKKDAVANDVFSGQEIRNYWPHMRDGAAPEFDDMVARHAEWLQSPEGEARLKKLKETDDSWLAGLIGAAGVNELAAMDLAKNWKSDAWVVKNPHLEKFRSGAMTDYSTSPDVVARYLRSVYPRIGEGRYLGNKAELVRAAVGQMASKDRQFVADAFKQSFGRKEPGIAGSGFEKGVREFNFFQGMSKLTNAALAQVAQPAAAMGHILGRHGVGPGLKAILRATDQTIRRYRVAADDAKRSGATHAADTEETMNAFSSSNSYSQKFLLDTLRLREIPVVREAIKTTWFVRDLDRRARVYADAMGRYGYLEALKAGDRKSLTEMLGGRPEMAELALREDLPHLKELEAAISSGRSGDVAVQGGHFLRTEKTTSPDGTTLATTRASVPLAKGYDLRSGVERMDRAGKFVSDKTQFRNRPMDAPLMWQHPVAKFLNPFMSFPLQHYYWQKGEIQGARKALKAGDKETAAKHVRTLLAFNAVFAPIMGGAAMSLRSFVQGKGTDSRQIDESSHPLLQAMEALGPDPIANDNWEKKLLVLEALQAWNFAGGIGLPSSMLERGVRSFVSERAGGDTGRAIASGLGGANVGTLYDAAVTNKDLMTLLLKWSSGKASRSDWNKAKRDLVNMTANVPFVNLPLGVGSSLRARANSGKKPPVSPGWAGALDKGATWNPRRGFTSPAADTQRKQNVEDWRDRNEREIANAEASWDREPE